MYSPSLLARTRVTEYNLVPKTFYKTSTNYVHFNNFCRLYRKRGEGECKNRVASKNIPSEMRTKLFKYRRVLRANETMTIIRQDHMNNHDGHNTAEIRLNEKYYIVGLRSKVMAVGGNNCTICAAHATVQKKPVQPILTSRRGQLVMFDLTKFYVPVSTLPLVVPTLNFITYQCMFVDMFECV